MTNKKIILEGVELLAFYDKLVREGYSVSDIAENLGMSRNALRWKIHRIRKENNLTGDRPGRQSKKQLESAPETETGKFEIKSKDNYLEIDSTIPRIKSLDDLLAAANVNLDEWRVERYVVNKWEVGAKTARRKLEWKDGQIVDGILDDPGKLTIEPLWQIKAWLIRRELIAIEPVISPISIHIAKTPPPEFYKTDGLNRALILPDIQTGFSFDQRTGKLDPFHDRRALDIALQFAERNDFDDLIFLGDVLDLPDWSDKFIRSPEFTQNTQAAIVELSWWLSQFRLASPRSRIALIEGNHDLRIKNSLRVHLNAAYGLRPANEINLPPSLSVERLLGLSALDIKYINSYPDAGVWLNDGLFVTHGEISRSTPGETAKQYAQKSDVSVIFGHIHRIERAARTSIARDRRKTISAVSPGCLCRLGGIVPGDKMSNDWQQGIAIVTYNPKSDFHMIETVEITDGLATYAGEIFESRDHVEQLSADTNYKF